LQADPVKSRGDSDLSRYVDLLYWSRLWTTHARLTALSGVDTEGAALLQLQSGENLVPQWSWPTVTSLTRRRNESPTLKSIA